MNFMAKNYVLIPNVIRLMFDNEDCGAREDVMRWADGYVLVYSIVSRKSFNLLQEVQKKVEEFKKGSNVPIVILANKADLEHMRQVTSEEGQTFAISLGCPFIELSASEDVSDVTDAFHALCRDIVEYKRRSRTFFDRVFGAFGREKVSS
ncbi:RSLBB-like protein [Mya arenaria]|uniref:small monomeric GTPase n=1 Tax=Mya arenaria TaxID=6604 RepID=A0ABY7EEZ5_MYAAR|nr:RSLBB-like protein [Mya arenaria]